MRLATAINEARQVRDDLHNVVEKFSEPGDAAAYLVILAAISDLMPAIAAFLSVVWMLIRIWESDTVRGLTGRAKMNERGTDE